MSTILLFLIFTALQDAALSQDHSKRQQPNIVFILSDDLGHADVGFTNGNIETPNLDKMASEGGFQIPNFKAIIIMQ